MCSGVFETYLVLIAYFIDLWCKMEWGELDVTLVYVHSDICETYATANSMPYICYQYGARGVDVSSVYVSFCLVFESYLV